jgi:hypothetical protein
VKGEKKMIERRTTQRLDKARLRCAVVTYSIFVDVGIRLCGLCFRTCVRFHVTRCRFEEKPFISSSTILVATEYLGSLKSNCQVRSGR